MTTKRQHAASVVLNDGLWILGGRDEQLEVLKTTEIIFTNGTVIPGPEMPDFRFQHTMTKINEYQYVKTGGLLYYQSFAKTYIFNSQSFTWRRGPNMKTARKSHSATIITDQTTKKSYLMVSGGYPRTLTTEYMDIAKLDRWMPGPDIEHGPIQDHSTISSKGNLIFIGGENLDTNSLEKSIYQLSMNNMTFKWTKLSHELKIPRRM